MYINICLKIHASYPLIKIYQIIVKNVCFLEILQDKKEKKYMYCITVLLGGGP